MLSPDQFGSIGRTVPAFQQSVAGSVSALRGQIGSAADTFRSSPLSAGAADQFRSTLQSSVGNFRTNLQSQIDALRGSFSGSSSPPSGSSGHHTTPPPPTGDIGTPPPAPTPSPQSRGTVTTVMDPIEHIGAFPPVSKGTLGDFTQQFPETFRSGPGAYGVKL